jgi:hypothetical protein
MQPSASITAAAGQDDFPNIRAFANISECSVDRRGRKRTTPSRPHHLAAEAEAAIDRANMGELEQNPVRITVDNSFQRAVCVVADRIGRFAWLPRKFGAIRHELSRDWVQRVGRIDESRQIRGQRNRVARRNLRDLVASFRARQPGGDQAFGAAKGGRPCHANPLLFPDMR